MRTQSHHAHFCPFRSCILNRFNLICMILFLLICSRIVSCPIRRFVRQLDFNDG
jgi:hypothetical protein